MNLRVAVHATATLPHVHHIFATGNARDQWRSLAERGQTIDARLAAKSADPTRHMRRMTLVAQHGGARFEHARHSAAVRIVAISTIVSDRVVLIHKGATLLGVTGLTGVIHGAAFGQLVACRAMDVVAVRASHLALRNRVMRRPIHLVTQIFVARVTRFRLIDSAAQYLVTIGMNLVAGVAGNIRCLVLTANPKRP